MSVCVCSFFSRPLLSTVVLFLRSITWAGSDSYFSKWEGNFSRNVCYCLG